MFGTLLGNVFGSGVGRFAGSVVDKVLGRGEARADTRAGAEEDTRQYIKRDKYDWSVAQERGLTPQEFYGSPAAGGSATNVGQTLGNNATARSAQVNDMLFQANENQKERENRKEIAEIQAGATKYGSTLTYDALMKRLNFDYKQFNEITLPQAGRIARKTEQEIKYLINQVATSEPKFIRMLKIMTMGTDNTLGLAIQNTLGIDVSDIEQMQNLSPEQRQALIQGMMAAGSVAAKEIAGGQQTVGQYLDTFVKGLEAAAKGAGDIFKPGIESVFQERTLGNNTGYETHMSP